MDHRFQYSLGQIVDAVNSTPTTIKSWLHKEVVVGSKNITGGGKPGVKRGFTFRSVMELALAKAILDNGPSDLKSAFNAAQLFAHTDGDDDGRAAALPFRQGRTLIAVSGASVSIQNWKPGEDCVAAMLKAMGHNPEGFVVIDAERVFLRVCRALGLEPNDVVKASYGTAQT